MIDHNVVVTFRVSIPCNSAQYERYCNESQFDFGYWEWAVSYPDSEYDREEEILHFPAMESVAVAVAFEKEILGELEKCIK